MKLHLGCGQKYFDGYINIDYPPSEHTVMNETVADEFHNLLELKYPVNSIEEVRLHHVFEHFPRSVAAALLASWNSWLKKDGILRIEVPDFYKTARSIFNPFCDESQKAIAMRHIFGSQEAHWAVHYDGYTQSNLKILLENFGFKINNFLPNSWKGTTHNIEVIATKIKDLNPDSSYQAAERYLAKFMVDKSESEQAQLAKWLHDYKNQFSKTFSTF
jgi:predicted SAM-dependent methyltransferase